MKNIHVLPTDKPSRLFKDAFGKYFISINIDQEQNHFKPQHLYITNDKEIKEGDWVITNGGLRFVTSINNDKSKTFTDNGSISKQSPSLYCYLEHYKKIILTTDQDLIKDRVQSIDDTFLEWFVKNPSCEEVEVTYDKDVFPYGVETAKGYGWYKIIIPQEEPKQLTVEEAAERYARFNFDSSFLDIDDHFIAGAEWRQERLYSEEDLKEAFRQGQDNMDYSEMFGWDSKLTEQQWFEQFKKK